MKLCTSCGNRLLDFEKICCPDCGAKVNTEVTTVDIQKQGGYSENTAPGRIFLHVAGVLYIAFGILSIMVALSGLTSIDYWEGDIPMSGISWYIYFISLLIASLCRVPIGVIGVINRKRLEKASVLRILGFIDIGIFAFSKVVLAIFFTASIITLFFAFFPPIFYLFGVSKNLKAYRNSLRSDVCRERRMEGGS